MDVPKIEKLDFSQFHPLDHWPGSPYCRMLPGKTTRHLQYAWEFKWHGKLLCPFGLHKFVPSSRSTGWTGMSCWYCSKEKQ